jgi:hypothetical protein
LISFNGLGFRGAEHSRLEEAKAMHGIKKPRKTKPEAAAAGRSVKPDDPEYWRQRAEKARLVAELMPNETVKQTMLSVAEECDRFAVRAAMHFDELAVSRVTDC